MVNKQRRTPTEQLHKIAQNFRIEGVPESFLPISIGHINETYKLVTEGGQYILQRINDQVFKKPAEVMENIERVGAFLVGRGYPKKILRAVPTIEGASFHQDKRGQYWRLFPFITDTLTINHVDHPDIAYQAAFAFGEYARYLSHFDISKLHVTIPDFHNTPLRFLHFKVLLKLAAPERLNLAKQVVQLVTDHAGILETYSCIAPFLSVVHYDTKINNLLLDEETLTPVCIIDLDTLMPGMLPYDFGDMVRTFTPGVDENEADLQQVQVRLPVYEALKEGFLDGIKGQIHPTVKLHLEDGAQLIIFEQAIRFLTDYLQGNLYYPVTYETQNLDRAKNQMTLLQDFLAKTRI